MLPADNNKTSILKATREAKGLTRDIVHEATKIPMDVLKAIEEGYSVRVLSPFYYRGFIKIYAEFLGLDVAETYKHYNLDQTPPKTVSSATPIVKSLRKESVPQQPNVLLEQMQEGLASFFTLLNLKRIFKFAGALFVFFLVLRMGGCVISHLPKKAPLVRRSFSVESKVHRYEQESPVPVVVPSVKHESVSAQRQGHKVQVAIRAMRDTWIQVKSDGRVVFQMTLRKGSMESWSADRRIELAGRNIAQLDMEVNGKHIGTLGGGERRVRRVWITPEGLTVKK